MAIDLLNCFTESKALKVDDASPLSRSRSRSSDDDGREVKSFRSRSRSRSRV